MRTVHVVVPAGVDDPARPSGGNVYDLRVCRELTDRGWLVVRHDVAGTWPRPGHLGRRAVGSVLDAVPDGSVVLVDGLVGSAAGELLADVARRLRIVLLVHLPLGVGAPDHASTVASEQRAVAAARAVVATSEWTRQWLVRQGNADPERTVVARPGTDPGPLAESRPEGNRLLTVGVLTAVKGQDRVLASLSAVRDLDWTWTCVGAGAVDPAYAQGLSSGVADRALGDRVRLLGPLSPEGLALAYAACDLLVVGSRHETYGMVVTEALARGIPVVAPPVGGIGEAVGAQDGELPGLIATSDDAAGLADALRVWLTDGGLRERARMAARGRRATLPAWSATAGAVEQALLEALS